MDVIATQQGFYGQLREVDEPFTISGPEAFSKVWMKKAPKVKAAAKADDDEKKPDA